MSGVVENSCKVTLFVIAGGYLFVGKSAMLRHVILTDIMSMQHSINFFSHVLSLL